MSDCWWVGWSWWAPPLLDREALQRVQAPSPKLPRPTPSRRARRAQKRSAARADRDQRRGEVALRVAGLLDGLPVVCRIRREAANSPTATVEFIDGTILEVTDRAEEALNRVAVLAKESGVWLERARCLPGQRSWVLRFRSVSGKRATVFAGVNVAAVLPKATPTRAPAPPVPDQGRNRRWPR